MPPKSILKTTSLKNSSTADRNRSLALHHAQLIQNQRDAESRILDATLQLIDLPADPTSDPAHPVAAETALFKQAVKSFQPKDYDDLIRERNIYEKCGYALCPRDRWRDKTGARSKVVRGTRRGETKIVSVQELEKWCSTDCAERALYVRVQLSDEPSWVRAVDGEQIVLLHEARASNQESESSKTSTADEEKGVTVDLHDLSIERGDAALGPTGKRVEVDIVEKTHSGVIPAPPSKTHEDGGTVEGHKPRKELLAGKDITKDDHEEEDDDILDLI